MVCQVKTVLMNKSFFCTEHYPPFVVQLNNFKLLIARDLSCKKKKKESLIYSMTRACKNIYV